MDVQVDESLLAFVNRRVSRDRPLRDELVPPRDETSSQTQQIDVYIRWHAHQCPRSPLDCQQQWYQSHLPREEYTSKNRRRSIQFTNQFFMFVDQTQLLDTTQIGSSSWRRGHRCATSRMQMAVGGWRCKCHWWKGQSYQRGRRDNLLSFGSVINEEVPRFLFGVRRGVAVSGRIELAAKLMTDASSWKFDNGWRRFAAKENSVFSLSLCSCSPLRVRWPDPGVCLAGVRRCFDGVDI